jgi:hypothetical protein
VQPDKAVLHREVLSDQLTRWCCIDRLSWQLFLGGFNLAQSAAITQALTGEGMAGFLGKRFGVDK